VTPAVILRNVLENPAWYTAYTPYQPEISQGRLEAMLNFQTMVCDLTAMEIANASMLDEATAAAEAMTLCRRVAASRGQTFFVADDVFAQTVDVVRTRAQPLGIEIVVGPAADAPTAEAFGILLQYPGANGDVRDYRALVDAVHANGALVVVAADLLALTLLMPPGEWGVDVVVGSSQRFGVPMGFGGPHAAFMATRDAFKRSLPGRLVGVTVDASGAPAYRLALQTREQHIRREKATSNICTAQVLLAIMAGMYAVYHGPDGLRRIARRVHALTRALAAGLQRMGHETGSDPFFDTLRVRPNGLTVESVLSAARSSEFNLRDFGEFLAARGARWTLSRIVRVNAPSLAAHARAGARALGNAIFVCGRTWQLSVGVRPALLHLSRDAHSIPRIAPPIPAPPDPVVNGQNLMQSR
jgi:glycine dehydrogenase